MKPYRLIYLKILVHLLLIVVVNFIIATVLITHFSKKDFHEDLRQHLYAEAMLVSEMIQIHGISPEKAEQMNQIVNKIGKDLDTRITIIMPDGEVYAESQYEPEIMENHLGRVEVQSALNKGVGTDSRISPTLGVPMTYLAVPVFENGEVKAIVRTAMSEERVREKIKRTVYRSVIIGALIGGLIAALISLFVARAWSRPIQLIRKAATNISRGDFGFRLNLQRNDELRVVADSINEMSEKLQDYFDSITEERERIRAILEGMKEELVLVRDDETIGLANGAFCTFFNTKREEIIGKKYWEVVLERDISEFISDALGTRKRWFKDLTYRTNGKGIKHYRLSASPVISETGGFRGIVVIFHDVTAIKEMEKMRREFVDNASHELKTPISATMAITETLMENEPEEFKIRHQFYERMHNNAVRLNNLINDLLSLSEIEQRKRSLELKPCSITGFLKNLVEDYSTAINSKKHEIVWEMEEEIPPVMANPKALSRAFGNIMGNAIQYTEEGGRIVIRCNKEEEGVRVEIEDNGIGIPHADIPRIFERFYRVDKARSVKQGGTGLGLSIAKHIIEAHGGRIEVKSAVKKGTTFIVYLPV